MSRRVRTHAVKRHGSNGVFRATVAPARSYVDDGDHDRAAVHPDHFRETMGTFPAPVSVVTALDSGGLPRGLTCSAVCSLSLEPPMLLVCVNRRNGTLAAIHHSNGFVVNLLRASSADVSGRFASPAADKYDGISWRPSPVSGLPWLHDDTLAHADCRLVADIAAGSHSILVGAVLDVTSLPAPAEPLLYFRRAYGSLRPDPRPVAPSPARQTEKDSS